jgi:hypothetical protein
MLIPSIYVLRKGISDMPKREDCSRGDIVILLSGDILVCTGEAWDLLPGRYMEVEELKEFVSYVSSGWPDDPGVAIADMDKKIPPEFLERMVITVRKLADSLPGNP